MVEVTYREHMFLENHLVPEKVRTHTTEVLDISGTTGVKKVVKDFSDLFQELSPFGNFSVICVSIHHNVIFNFNQEVTKHLLPLNETNCKP